MTEIELQSGDTISLTEVVTVPSEHGHSDTKNISIERLADESNIPVERLRDVFYNDEELNDTDKKALSRAVKTVSRPICNFDCTKYSTHHVDYQIGNDQKLSDWVCEEHLNYIETVDYYDLLNIRESLTE